MASQRDRIELVCGLLALLVAGIHLWWGLPRFALYATVGTLVDPRPFAFVLSGHAIAIGITLAAVDVVERRHLYLPGIGLMLVHLGGYVAWHTVLAHGIGLGTPHEHLSLLTALPIVLEDLLGSPIALVAKAAEAAVTVLLGWLVLADHSAGDASD